MSIAKTSKREWTEDEVDELCRLAKQRIGLRAIATALGRSTASVRQKAFWLDLSLESNVAIRLKANGK
jgi:hypothetical protein